MRFTIVLAATILIAAPGASARRSTPVALPAFATCLHAHALNSRRFPDRLELPTRLPKAVVIDRAFRACHRFTLWPRGYGSSKVVYVFLDRSRRFRACMRANASDPGLPIVILTLRGIGSTFPHVPANVPASCNQILFGH